MHLLFSFKPSNLGRPLPDNYSYVGLNPKLSR